MSLASAIVDLFLTLFVIVINYIKAIIACFSPPPRKSIDGEIALITGAGHGIGKEFALEISKLGATVVIWDINKESNEKTRDEIRKAGGKAFSYTCDITNSALVASVAEKVQKEVGEITILVNNAGVANCGPFLDLSEKDIRRTFEVNTLSHYWIIKEFLPAMMKAGRGHILNVISMAGLSGFCMLTDYSASKHAAFGFHKSLLEELYQDGYHNIKMTALCPAFVDTGLLKNFTVQPELLLTPREVALTGIDGMLRNYELVTAPSYLYYINKWIQILPVQTQLYLLRKSGVSIRSQYKKEN